MTDTLTQNLRTRTVKELLTEYEAEKLQLTERFQAAARAITEEGQLNLLNNAHSLAVAAMEHVVQQRLAHFLVTGNTDR
jgi:hypothetical protein